VRHNLSLQSDLGGELRRGDGEHSGRDICDHIVCGRRADDIKCCGHASVNIGDRELDDQRSGDQPGELRTDEFVRNDAEQFDTGDVTFAVFDGAKLHDDVPLFDHLGGQRRKQQQHHGQHLRDYGVPYRWAGFG
jgi:hypothetical protein